MVLLGGSPLLTWSRTQQSVALSSGESGYYAITSGAVEGLGLVNLLAELGLNVRLNLLTDSSAAKKAIEKGQGTRMKHIALRLQFMHQLVKQKLLYLIKVKGEDNLADILTKFVVASVLESLVFLGGLVFGLVLGVLCVSRGVGERARETERARKARTPFPTRPLARLLLPRQTKGPSPGGPPTPPKPTGRASQPTTQGARMDRASSASPTTATVLRR
jgi:hypothetical protein